MLLNTSCWKLQEGGAQVDSSSLWASHRYLVGHCEHRCWTWWSLVWFSGHLFKFLTVLWASYAQCLLGNSIMLPKRSVRSHLRNAFCCGSDLPCNFKKEKEKVKNTADLWSALFWLPLSDTVMLVSLLELDSLREGWRISISNIHHCLGATWKGQRGVDTPLGTSLLQLNFGAACTEGNRLLRCTEEREAEHSFWNRLYSSTYSSQCLPFSRRPAWLSVIRKKKTVTLH